MPPLTDFISVSHWCPVKVSPCTHGQLISYILFVKCFLQEHRIRCQGSRSVESLKRNIRLPPVSAI
jgi:hypothetical protein